MEQGKNKIYELDKKNKSSIATRPISVHSYLVIRFIVISLTLVKRSGDMD